MAVALDRDLITARIVAMAQNESELSHQVASDVAFHMTDWLNDLEDWHRFCSSPGSLSDVQLEKLLLRVLTHVPNHLAAAAKLFADIQTTDAFGVGATRDEQ